MTAAIHSHLKAKFGHFLGQSFIDSLDQGLASSQAKEITQLAVQTITPFQRGLAAGNLEACKIAIDLGNVPTERETQDLRIALVQRGVLSCSIELFFIQRPLQNRPQILLGNTFVYLDSTEDNEPPDKPIALFFISNEKIDKNFGAITQEFGESRNAYYQTMASRFTVIRILINDRDQICPLMALVKKKLYWLPIRHLNINGHGAENCVEVGFTSRLTIKDTSTMEEMGNFLDFLASIGVGGCECASQPDNLVQTISQHAKRVTMGSFWPVTSKGSVIATSLLHPDQPILLSNFIDARNVSNTRAYKEGKLIAMGALPHPKIEAMLVKAIEEQATFLAKPSSSDQ